MFEQNRYKNLYVTTLNVTGTIFVYYEIDKPYLGNVCLAQPQGHASGFHDLINFLNLFKELLYLILFGASSLYLILFGTSSLWFIHTVVKSICISPKLVFKQVLEELHKVEPVSANFPISNILIFLLKLIIFRELSWKIICICLSFLMAEKNHDV